MDNKISMRDAFFGRLYARAKEDRNIIVVSADMGAPALDNFRLELPNQHVFTGIAEQSAFLVASGLALSGKKPFVYAIAPFVTSRTHEFIKIEMGLMGLPIRVVGVGAGYSYDEAGPTHHTLEDISLLRTVPKTELLSPSDSVMAAAFADRMIEQQTPAYVRLDRKLQDVKYSGSERFEEGFKELNRGSDIAIVTTGNMVDRALAFNSQEFDNTLGVIDVYRLKPLNSDLRETLCRYKAIISLEEHFLAGGLGSIISENITDNDLPLKLRRLGVNDTFVYEYGGRENIQKKVGLSVEDVKRTVGELRGLIL